MNDDGLNIFDIERAILTGHVGERQKDQKSDKWKYLVLGASLQKHEVVVVAKLSVTGKLVIITVFIETK